MVEGLCWIIKDFKAHDGIGRVKPTMTLEVVSMFQFIDDITLIGEAIIKDTITFLKSFNLFHKSPRVLINDDKSSIFFSTPL
jgi:hypothetical protein